MPTARPPASQALLMLLSCCLAAGAALGADIGDYEYFYDELPREHLAPLTRLGRAVHVQHVPADAPRAPQPGDPSAPSSSIQRVPRRALPPVPADEAAEATATEAAAPTAPRPQEPEPAAELQPPPRMEGATRDAPTQQAPHVPAAVPDELGKEDMETANFFWGLGPVYPHLYVYQRVPHLVPLHGWNPYHAFVLTHPSR